MANRNIFSGFGLKSEFVNLIYQELMKGHFLTYADILSIYYGREAGYYDRIACNSESGYGELKKAFPMVLKALEAKSPHTIMRRAKSGCPKILGRLCRLLQSICRDHAYKLVLIFF